MSSRHLHTPRHLQGVWDQFPQKESPEQCRPDICTLPDTSRECGTSSPRWNLQSNVVRTSAHSQTPPGSVGPVALEGISGAMSSRHLHTPSVTITPYLSRDTTYCYRHCKGISRFPLLLHHPSPRPMPDRTTSTSLTFAYVTTPYRTHASNPHHVYRLTDSLVPLISLPHFPLDVIMTYDSDPDSDLILPMTSLLTDPLR